MTDDGVFVMNINSAWKARGPTIFRSMHATIESAVFRQCYVFAKDHRAVGARAIDEHRAGGDQGRRQAKLSAAEWLRPRRAHRSTSYIQRHHLRRCVSDLLIDLPDHDVRQPCSPTTMHPSKRCRSEVVRTRSAEVEGYRCFKNAARTRIRFKPRLLLSWRIVARPASARAEAVPPPRQDLPVILLTGFEPFGPGRPPNPSWEAIKPASAASSMAIGLSPATGSGLGCAADEAARLDRRTKPVAIFSFGQGERRLRAGDAGLESRGACPTTTSNGRRAHDRSRRAVEH